MDTVTRWLNFCTALLALLGAIAVAARAIMRWVDKKGFSKRLFASIACDFFALVSMGFGLFAGWNWSLATTWDFMFVFMLLTVFGFGLNTAQVSRREIALVAFQVANAGMMLAIFTCTHLANVEKGLLALPQASSSASPSPTTPPDNVPR
jgi:hypothetical protein